MSLGYAEKLSYIEDVGKVGMKEHFDPPRVLHQKVWILHLSLVFFNFFFFAISQLFLWIDGIGDRLLISLLQKT